MAENIFDGISYSKGAAVIRQLFNYVGESTFSLIMMRYFTRLYNSNATLDDLIWYFEDLLDEDFQPFVKDWIKTAGKNTVRAVTNKKEGVIEIH